MKNHSLEQQMQIKQKAPDKDQLQQKHSVNQLLCNKFFDPTKQKAIKNVNNRSYTNSEHNYFSKTQNINTLNNNMHYNLLHIKKDLKNKIAEKYRIQEII